jgi:3-oxoadipyl-CoA thiolase
MCGQIDFAIAGGVESMSRAPFVMGKAETAWSRSASIEDTTIGWRFINPMMKKLHGVDSMPETAENVAVAHGISRDEQDAFALRSQELAAKAQQRGFFSEEIIPVTVTAKKCETVVSMDEHPRANTTLESLSGLRPVVREGGTVTAGNASGVNDGSAAMLIASESAVKRHGLKPKARFLGMATAGVPPKVMGIGPAPASEKLMQRLGLGIDDFDLIELNEAFASQVIASLRMLQVDPFDERVNPHGGAIALGHPLGMSGARLVLTAARALEQSGGSRALITMCIGVGQGLAIAIERV